MCAVEVPHAVDAKRETGWVDLRTISMNSV